MVSSFIHSVACLLVPHDPHFDLFQLTISTGHFEYPGDGLFMMANLISAKWN